MNNPQNFPIKNSLSKSDYLKAIQCKKSLWFSKNRADLKPPLDDKTKSKFETGEEITQLARNYFLGGVKAAESFFDVKKAVNSTNELIAQNHSVIFEATAIIEADNCHARIDILRKSQNPESWDLIEVKGSTSIKANHLEDLSFQYHVFTKAGYKIDRCFLMLLDGKYKRDGELDLNKLFKIGDVTEAVLEKQSEVEANKSDFLKVLTRQFEPEAKIGAHCFEKDGHYPQCNFKDHCWHEIPKYSVFDVCHRKKTAEKIVDQIDSYRVEDLNIADFTKGIKEIDVRSYQQNKTHIDQTKLREWLEKLKYPLFFLDYESFQSAIPLFNNASPYQQIPFQFSLHVQKSVGGELKHFEFLHQERSDPREEFIKELIRLCAGEGNVICYYKSFEETRNKELAADFPNYADAINNISERMVDLWKPFNDRLIYSPKQQGSASIKNVLPAFTNLNYQGMEIANGTEAMEIYLDFIKGKKVDEAKMINDLLSYCKLDTYAMVELIGVLKSNITIR
jgi:hypothetical protein